MNEQSDTLQDSPLKTALKKLVPVNVLPPEQFDQFANQLKLETAPAGSVLFWHGDTDSRVVYLLSGEVSLKDENNSVLYQVRGGSDRARYPLAHELPRETTAVAETQVAYVHIDMHALDSLMSPDYSVDYQLGGIRVSEINDEDNSDWHAFVLQSDVFSSLSPLALQKLMIRLTPVPVRAGDVVIRQGEVANYYYLMRDGRCRVSRFIPSRKEQIVLAELGPGDAFGEEALILHTLRNATITMLSDGLLLRMTSTDFVELLEQPLLQRTDRDEAERLVAQGAVWLDVRAARDFKQEHLPDSINLPYHSIRQTMHGLDRSKRYIVRSATGKEAAVTAFLMQQQGFNASALVVDARPAASEAAHDLTSEHVHADVDQPASHAAGTPAPISMADPSGDDIKHLQQEYKLLKQVVQTEVEKRQLAEQEAQQLRKSVDEARKAAESEMIRIAKERMNIRKIQQQSLAQIRNEQRSLRDRTDDEIRRLKDEAEQARQQAEREADQLKQEARQILDQARQAGQFDENRQMTLAEQTGLSDELQRIRAERDAAQRELDELHRRVDEEADRLDSEVEAVQELEHTRQDTQAEVEQLRAEAEQARQAAARAREQAEQQAGQLARQEASLQDLQQSREEALNALGELEARQLELENIQGDRGAMNAELEQLRSQVTQARQEVEAYHQQVAEEGRRLDSLKQQQADLQALEQERKRVAGEIETLRELADQARQEATDAQLRMEQLLDKIDSENQEMQDMQALKQQLREELHALQSQRDRAEAKARQADARKQAHHRLETVLGNLQAREEAAHLRAEAEQLRLQAEEEAINIRTEAEQLRLKAREELSRARTEAEQLRLQTEEELARLRNDPEQLLPDSTDDAPEGDPDTLPAKSGHD